VARCWTHETAVLLNEELNNEIPFHGMWFCMWTVYTYAVYDIHANFPDLCGILPIWSCQKGKSRYPDWDCKNTPKSRLWKNISHLMTTNHEFRTQI
jgi:hypothetical protein